MLKRKQKELYNLEDLKMIIPCFLKSLKQEIIKCLEEDEFSVYNTKTPNSENLRLLKEYLEQIKFLNLDTYINEIEETTDHKIPFITQMILKKEIIDNTIALEGIMK